MFKKKLYYSILLFYFLQGILMLDISFSIDFRILSKGKDIYLVNSLTKKVQR